MERQLDIDKVRAGQRGLNSMGDTDDKDNASELQVPGQSADSWQEAGMHGRGRGKPLGMLFHSLTERKMIPITAEQWLPSER